MKASSWAEMWADKRRLTALLVAVSAALALGAAGMYFVNRAWLSLGASRQVEARSQDGDEAAHGDEARVTLPKEKWRVAGLRVEPDGEAGLQPAFVEQETTEATENEHGAS